MHPCCMKLWARAKWDAQGTRFKCWSIGFGWFGAENEPKFCWKPSDNGRPSGVQWWHSMRQRKSEMTQAQTVSATGLLACNSKVTRSGSLLTPRLDAMMYLAKSFRTQENDWLTMRDNATENWCNCWATAQQLLGDPRILQCAAESWGSQDPRVALSRQSAHCGDSRAAKCTLVQPLQLDFKTLQMELKWFSHFPVMPTSALRLNYTRAFLFEIPPVSIAFHHWITPTCEMTMGFLQVMAGMSSMAGPHFLLPAANTWKAGESEDKAACTYMNLSVCISVYLSMYIRLSVYLSVHLSICRSVCLSISRSISIHRSVHPSVHTSIDVPKQRNNPK